MYVIPMVIPLANNKDCYAHSGEYINYQALNIEHGSGENSIFSNTVTSDSHLGLNYKQQKFFCGLMGEKTYFFFYPSRFLAETPP